jgi:hypothetical protein
VNVSIPLAHPLAVAASTGVDDGWLAGMRAVNHPIEREAVESGGEFAQHKSQILRLRMGS